ncbi:MAG: hypothetical protein EOP04_17580 [Proteobacteria bacterium]|nr:MAG: hypothetical protein EOP04_17580 [Pseudomonadota bacterium]
MKMLILMFLVATVFDSPAVHALPIFSESDLIKTPGGLTLYPDSQDASLLYYYPAQANLVTGDNDLLRFSLVYWGLKKKSRNEIQISPQDAGGLLSFLTQLSLSLEQKQELAARVDSGLRLAILQIEKSTLKFGGEPVGSGSILEEVSYPSYSAPIDGYTGMNAVLSGHGAKWMISQLMTHASLNMKYCHEFLGISNTASGSEIKWSSEQRHTFCVPIDTSGISHQIEKYLLSADGVSVH